MCIINVHSGNMCMRQYPVGNNCSGRKWYKLPSKRHECHECRQFVLSLLISLYNYKTFKLQTSYIIEFVLLIKDIIAFGTF